MFFNTQPRAKKSFEISKLFQLWKFSFTKSNTFLRTNATVLSLLLAFAQAAGMRLQKTGQVFSGDTVSSMIMLLDMLVMAALFACLIFPTLYYSQKWSGFRFSERRGLWAFHPGKRLFIVFLCLAAIWFIYWLLLWPGAISSGDSMIQIGQAMGVIKYEDHHPIANTLAIQLFLRPAMWLTGNNEIAVSLVVLIQLLVVAVIVAACICAMAELPIPNWFLTTTLVFIVGNPLVGWYAVTLWKDIWLAVFLLALATTATLFFYRIYTNKQLGKWLPALLGLSAVAAMFSKKSGLYVIVLLFIVGFFYLKKHRLLWSTVGAVSIVIYLVGHAAILSLLNVTPGSEREALSLPSQQMARTLRDNPQGITAEQKESLAKYYPHADLGDLYTPVTSDPVKATMDADAVTADATKYLKLWAEIGIENPLIYADAALEGSYGYWYPPVRFWMVERGDWVSGVNIRGHTPEEKASFDPLINDNRNQPRNHTQIMSDTLNDFRDMPVISWLFSLGAWTWASLVLIFAAIVRRQPLAIPAACVSVAVWLSCVLSPVFAMARYEYPMLLILPLLLAATYLPVQEKEEKTSDMNEAKTSVNEAGQTA